MTPSETTATGKVEGLPEKPAKAPAEKLVKTPVKAPKAVKTAELAKTISIKSLRKLKTSCRKPVKTIPRPPLA
jgi:hypothetical protein